MTAPSSPTPPPAIDPPATAGEGAAVPALKVLLDPFPPKAAQLIVTIYGDIVEPRGGVLWMGDLITLCAGFGVNESLVRTAVSRLVSREQLVGVRDGRRSYYALTPRARHAFHEAAELFFGPPDGDCGLILVHQPDQARRAEMLFQGFAEIADTMVIGADRPGRVITGARFTVAERADQAEERRALLHKAFELGELAQAYAQFIDRFGELLAPDLPNLPASDLLSLRLALVHAYRKIRLRDPRLPASALPPDWPGTAARALFATIYCGLSETVDPYIGGLMSGRDGALAARPAEVEARLRSLQTRV